MALTTEWYAARYVPRENRRYRYCKMDDFTATLVAEGGSWVESEVLGDQAVVKVIAEPATHAAIRGAAGIFWFRIQIDDSMSTLTALQRQAVNNHLVQSGYSQAEVDAAFPGGLQNYTLRQVLDFYATRRLKPRYDSTSGNVVCDGEVQACTPISVLEPLP